MEGEPGVTEAVAAATPSMRMVTVPEGYVVEGLAEVMSAVTIMEPPAVGVSVEGIMVMVSWGSWRR